jgi:hypothetical protein
MSQISADGGPGGGKSRHFPHGRLTRDVIGVFLDVYNELRYGLPEAVYHAAMSIVLGERGLQSQSEAKLDIHFHGQRIGSYRADIIVEDKVILELKAGASLPIGAGPIAQLPTPIGTGGRPSPVFWPQCRVRARGGIPSEERSAVICVIRGICVRGEQSSSSPLDNQRASSAA